MFTFSQWLHQHEILLVCAALILLVTVVLILRWRSIWMWFAWFAISGISVGALIVLRTPAASVSEFRGPDAEILAYDIQDISFAYSEPAPKSIEEIEKLVGQVGKPTLVEIYADYGFA